MSSPLDDRVDRVYALSRTLLDYLPSPRTATGQIVASSSLPGPAPSTTVTCPRCQGRGRIGTRPCDHPACRHGALRVDAYTLQPVQTEPEQQPRAMTGREITAAIDRLDDTRPGSLEARIDRRDQAWRQGSYRDLLCALRWLQRAYPARSSGWWTFVICDPDGALPRSARLEAELDVTAGRVACRMPQPIMLPRWLEAEDVERMRQRWLWRARGHRAALERERRDCEIRELRAQGVEVRELARTHGLSVGRVYAIVTDQVAIGGTAA